MKFAYVTETLLVNQYYYAVIKNVITQFIY